MIIINLRKYYPELYGSDYEIAVHDEVAAALCELRMAEAAAKLRTYRAKAYYSLNRGDQIEHEALFKSLSPYEVLEGKLVKEQLYAALAHLSDKQSKRIYAHFFLNMSIPKLAQAEGVSEQNIRKSIKRGLQNMAQHLKNLF